MRCSFARWRPLPESGTQARITPRKLLLHSAVNYGHDLWPYFAGPTGAESHFYVDLDGGLDQFMDTEEMAHANVAADVDAISVETADNGNPDAQPWNDAQLATLERLGVWVLENHTGVAPQRVPYPAGAGIGYHSMFKDGGGWSPWSNARGKTCPGAARIAQFPALLERIINGSQEENMPTIEEVRQAIHDELDRQFDTARPARTFFAYMLAPLHNGQVDPANKDTSAIQGRVATAVSKALKDFLAGEFDLTDIALGDIRKDILDAIADIPEGMAEGGADLASASTSELMAELLRRWPS